MNECRNVSDRRRQWIGSWVTAPLDASKLSASDIGRTVIYIDYGRAEAGTIVSWRGSTVFARYTTGDTAAGADANDLMFGIRALDGPALLPQDGGGQ